MADVVTYGALAWLTDALDGLTYYLGWGTGAAEAARSDSTLSTEASESRVSCSGASVTRQTVVQANDTLQIQGTMTANGTKTITNAGILTASSGGTLLLHSSFNGISLAVGNTVAFTFKLRFT